MNATDPESSSDETLPPIHDERRRFFPEPPSARRLLGLAFDLDLRASRDLRSASLFMALQFLFIVGPLALVLAALFIQLPAYLDVFDPAVFDPTLIDEQAIEEFIEPFLVFATQLSLVATIAVLGWIAITVESQIVAITILAGRLLGRPVTLREAIARSRQSFWRVVRAAFLVGIPAAIAGAVVSAAFGPDVDPVSETFTLVSLAVGIAVAVPFAYFTTGIVLGDVGARESIVRGYRLVRSRWSLAIVIAAFTAAAQFLQVFAIGAGGDLVARIAIVLDLGFDHGALQSALTYVVIIASIVAVGTLLFTTIAISVAPQVVAFLALTRVATGLDRIQPTVRGPAPPPEALPEPLSPEPPSLEVTEALVPEDDVNALLKPAAADVAPRPSPWDQVPPPSTTHRLVSLPMVAGAILAAIVAVAALGSIPSLG